MTLRTLALRGLKWQAIEIAGRQILSLLIFTLLARMLDPTAFGLLGMVAVYLALIGLLVEQGLGTAIVQRKDLQGPHLDTAFWFNLCCAGVWTGITIGLASPIAQFFNEPRLAPLLQWGSLGLVVSASAGVHSALFIREMDFRRPALRSVAGTVAGGCVGIGMAVAGCGVWSLIGQQLASSIAGALLVWQLSPWRPQLRFSSRSLRDLLPVSAPVFATGFLWFVSSRAEHVLIGQFLGSALLGYYIVAGKLSELARLLLHQPIASVSLPALAKVQDDHDRLRSVVYRGMDGLSIVAFPMLLGIVATAPTAIPLLFGTQWHAAVLPAQLIAVYTLCNLLQVFFHPILIATGGPKGYLVLNIIHAAGAVSACLIGVQFGLLAVVAGLTANTVVVGLLAFNYLRQRVGLSWQQYWSPCAAPATAAIVMLICVTMVKPATNAVLVLGIQISVGAAAYAVVLACLAPTRVWSLVAPMLRAFIPSGIEQSPSIQRD